MCLTLFAVFNLPFVSLVCVCRYAKQCVFFYAHSSSQLVIAYVFFHTFFRIGGFVCHIFVSDSTRRPKWKIQHDVSVYNLFVRSMEKQPDFESTITVLLRYILNIRCMALRMALGIAVRNRHERIRLEQIERRRWDREVPRKMDSPPSK